MGSKDDLYHKYQSYVV